MKFVKEQLTEDRSIDGFGQSCKKKKNIYIYILYTQTTFTFTHNLKLKKILFSTKGY